MPYWFPDYLAFPAFATTGALVMARLPVRVRLGLAAAIGILLIGTAANRAGTILAVTATVLAAVTIRSDGTGRFRFVQVGGQLVRWSPMLVPLAALGVSLSLWVIGRAALPTEGLDILWRIEAVSGTLESRARLVELGVTALADRPAALLHGFGWGSDNDLLSEYLLLDDVTLITGPESEISNWDAIDNNHFHSHNSFLEALLAAGLPGLVGYLALFTLPVATAPPDRQWAAALGLSALAGLHATWFQLPATLPITTLPITTLPITTLLLGLVPDPAARLLNRLRPPPWVGIWVGPPGRPPGSAPGSAIGWPLPR